MPFSETFRHANINRLRNTAAAAIAQPYVALFNGDPSSGGTEVTASIRPAGRVAVTFGAPSAGVATNSATVDFGQSQSASPITVSYIAIYDAASSGNLLAWVSVTTQSVAQYNGVTIAAGALSASET